MSNDRMGSTSDASYLLQDHSRQSDSRKSPQDGPKQDPDLGIGDKEHGPVIVLLDKVADQGLVLFHGGMLSGLGACGGSAVSGRAEERDDKRREGSVKVSVVVDEDGWMRPEELTL